MRSRSIYIILFLAIIIAVLYSPLTPYLIKDYMTSRLEKAIDMSVVFGKTHFDFPARLTVLDVKAMDKNGPALMAERAYFQLNPSKIIKANVVLDCDFKNVNISSGLCNSLNGLLKPLGVPVQDNYKFEDITATITIKRNSLEVHGLNAVGPDFRLLGEFTRFKDKKVDYNMDFKINKRVLGPEEGKKNQFLVDEDQQEWYSIKLAVKGDPRKPSSISFSTGSVKLEVQSTGGKK